MELKDIYTSVLSSEYAEYLPDGSGLSFPAYVMENGILAVQVFVNSSRSLQSAAPRGLFTIATDSLSVTGYRPIKFSVPQEMLLPKMSKENRIRLSDEYYEDFMIMKDYVFSPDLSETQKTTRSSACRALTALAGDTLVFYENVFPEYIKWISL